MDRAGLFARCQGLQVVLVNKGQFQRACILLILVN